MPTSLSRSCPCGAVTAAHPLLAGGPIPCVACGRALTERSAGRSAVRASGPVRAPATRRAIARNRNASGDLPALSVALLVCYAVAATLDACGPAALGPRVYTLASALGLLIDLSALVAAGLLVGLPVGVLSEAVLKVGIVIQVAAAAMGLAALLGGAAPLVAALGLLAGTPLLYARLFDWHVGQALLVWLAQVGLRLAVLQLLGT